MKPIEKVHKKLETFVKKYYTNQIIRGILLLILLFVLLFLSLIFTEYWAYFSVSVRTILYFSAIILLILVFLIGVIKPFLARNRIIKTINMDKVNGILQSHFPELKDQLKNVLELENSQENLYSQELLEAAIEQKSKQIQLIPFSNAIQFKSNLKYLKLIVIPLVALLLLYVFSPNVIIEGAERIINYDKHYEKPSDFWFLIDNSSLSVRSGKNLMLKVHAEGKYVPNPIYIEYGGLDYLLQKESSNEFTYEFTQVNQNFEFKLKAEEYQTKPYQVKVLPDPKLLGFDIEVIPPVYTQAEKETISNNGDILVPIGSKVQWNFKTSEVNRLSLQARDTILDAQKHDMGKFTIDLRLMQDMNYTISTANDLFTNAEVLKYKAIVIPDEYPNIQVQQAVDSAQMTVSYFRGQAQDDYGIRQILFCYRIEDEDKTEKITIPDISKEPLQSFFYAFNFKEIISNGQRISYFFEVWDNDGVNGSKRSQSKIFQYYLPSQKELEQLEESTSTNLQDKLAETQKLTKELKLDIKNLKKDMVDKELNNWELTQKLKNINKKQSNIQKKMEEVAQQNKKTNELIKNLSNEEQELLDKQKQIEEMLNQLMDEEMKKMMDEINKLMKEFDKDKFNELTEEMDMSIEDLEEQLDRNLEQLKRFEVEKKMDKVINDLDKLADEHEKLSEETKEGKTSNEELKEKQAEHEKALEDIKKDLEEVKKKNEALEEPMKMDDFSEQMQQTQEEMQESSKNLDKGKKKKASKGQKYSAEQMKSIALQMQQMMQNMQKQQQEQDMESLKRIVKNLNTFSFVQEDIMLNYRGLRYNNPKYIELFSEQRKIAEGFEMIRDSLYALAKLQPMLASPINKELLSVERELSKTDKHLDEHRTGRAQQSQQFTMTSANNLTLLLSEVLDQMKRQQQQSQSQCQKPGNCQKPGGKPKPGFGQSKKQAQSLKSQMKNMLKQLKEGDKGKSKGKGKGSKSMNGKIGKMIAEQEKMQKMLSDLANSQGVSPGTAKKLKEIKNQSEKISDDLIQQNITPSLLKRQELIITKLLEAENSEFKRELDKKRESKTSYFKEVSNPKDIFDKQEKQDINSNMLMRQKLKLNSFYKKEYQNYMMKLNK